MKKAIILLISINSLYGQTTYEGQILKDINPSGNSNITGLTKFGNKYIFSADNGSNGNEPWVTDGTNTGTIQIKDIFPGSAGAVPNSSSPANFIILGTNVLFTANTSSGACLWTTDGSLSGTINLQQFATGSAISPLTKHNNNVYFYASDGSTGTELWVSDGSIIGTHLVKDINVGVGDSNPQYICSHSDGKIYFQANDGISGAELWVSDGTALGTVLLSDMIPGNAGSYPANFYSYNGNIYFAGYDLVNQQQLWISNGTSTGTTLFKIINNSFNAYPTEFMTLNGKMIFLAEQNSSDQELWVSDGTAGGTMLLKDINGTPNTSSAPTQFYMANNVIYFSANDGINGREFWATDGTNAGTTMISNINPGAGSSDPSAMFYNGTKYFLSANNGTGSNEIYTYDLSNSNTDLYCKINTAGPSNPSYIFEIGSDLYSVAEGLSGNEIYKIIQVVGINELSNIKMFYVHPNPSNDFVLLPENMKDKSYCITDVTGKVLVKGIYNGNISTKDLLPGMYFIQVGDVSGKFVKD